MKINLRYIAVGMIIAFTLLFELAAHADESNQATTITFSQPIQIPGQILPAGTYSFKLLDSNSDPNVVQIFNSDQTHLYATLQTVATERQDPTGDTAITLAEQGGGKRNRDRKSTRLNSSHGYISYAVFCLKKK